MALSTLITYFIVAASCLIVFGVLVIGWLHDEGQI